MPYRPQIFVDFDGTISVDDTTDAILEQLAEPEWTAVEAAWQRGEIGSRECMAAQVALLRATPDAFVKVVSGIAIDPGFEAFLALCQRQALPVSVLSDGMDLVAEGVLTRLGVALPVLSNHLAWQGGDRWQLSFPHAQPNCLSGAGNCKCGQLAASRAADRQGGPRVLIGDGRSDFCGASEADMVFAKGKLAAHCREKGIPHIAFETFADLLPAFTAWLETVEAAALPAAR